MNTFAAAKTHKVYLIMRIISTRFLNSITVFLCSLIFLMGCEHDISHKKIKSEILGEWTGFTQYEYDNARTEEGAQFEYIFSENGTCTYSKMSEGGFTEPVSVEYSIEGSQLTLDGQVYTIERLNDNECIINFGEYTDDEDMCFMRLYLMRKITDAFYMGSLEVENCGKISPDNYNFWLCMYSGYDVLTEVSIVLHLSQPTLYSVVVECSDIETDPNCFIAGDVTVYEDDSALYRNTYICHPAIIKNKADGAVKGGTLTLDVKESTIRIATDFIAVDGKKHKYCYFGPFTVVNAI